MAEIAASSTPSSAEAGDNSSATNMNAVTARVLFDYTAQADDELTLHAGDIVTNVQKKDNGWVHVTMDHQHGFFPAGYLGYLEEKEECKIPRQATVIKSSTPEYDGELALEMNAVIEITDINTSAGPGWWKGKYKGKSGFFPAHYVELREESDQEESEDDDDVEKKWNVAQANTHFTGRKTAMSLVHNVLAESGKTIENNVIICGGAGVGKTELALMYCEEYDYVYDKICWLNAESKYTLLSGLQNMCDHLGIPVEADEDVTSIIRKLRIHYGDISVLIVFDNLEDETIIPNRIFYQEANMRFLMTSQRSACTPQQNYIFKHYLIEFEQDDAMRLIKKAINPSLCDKERRSNFAKKLEFNPMAIQMAAAYMEKFQVSSLDYEKLYEGIYQKYITPVERTFSISMTNFKEIESNSLIEFTGILSLLSGNVIDEDLLAYDTLKHEGGFNVRKALEKLAEYHFLQKRVTTSSGKHGYYTMHDHLKQLIKKEVSNVTELTSKIIDMIKSYVAAVPSPDHASFVTHCACHLILIMNEYSEDISIMERLDELVVDVVHTFIMNYASYKIANDILQARIVLETKFDSPSITNTRYMAGACYERHGEYNAAIAMYNQVRKAKREALGKSHAETIEVDVAIATCFVKKGKYDDALKIHRKIHDAEKTELGADTQANQDIAFCLEKSGDYPKAQEVYQEILDERKTKLGMKHAATREACEKVAECLLDAGNVDQALDMYHDILEAIRDNKMGVDNPESLRTNHNIAVCLEYKGTYDEAEAIYRQVHMIDAIDQAKLDIITPDALITHRNIAKCLSKQGRYGAALDIYSTVYSAQKKSLGIEHEDTLKTKERLDRCVKIISEK